MNKETNPDMTWQKFQKIAYDYITEKDIEKRRKKISEEWEKFKKGKTVFQKKTYKVIESGKSKDIPKVLPKNYKNLQENHMICKRLSGKKYENRSEPPFLPEECQDFVMVGNNKRKMYKSMYINGEWKWVQLN